MGGEDIEGDELRDRDGFEDWIRDVLEVGEVSVLGVTRGAHEDVLEGRARSNRV